MASRLQATAISQEEVRSAEPPAKKQKQQSNLPKAKLRPPPQTEQVPSTRPHPPRPKGPTLPSTASSSKALEKPSKPEPTKPADAVRQQAGRVPSTHPPPPSTKDPMPSSTPSSSKALEKPSKSELTKPADAVRHQKPGTYPILHLNSLLIINPTTAIPANRLPTAFGTPDLNMLPPLKAPRRPNPFAKKKDGGK